MRVCVVDYGSGNLRSCAKAFERAASDAGIDATIEVSGSPKAVQAADRIVLPGVGAFADCRRGLDDVPGLIEALSEAVTVQAKPFFGICVGMQLMADVGREFGDTPGLGWIGGEVVALKPSDAALKIPHMGWNDLQIIHPHPLLDGIEAGSHAYFVHSYQFCVKDEADIVAIVDYGGPVTAVVARGNMVGTQFHPEKSQAVGLGIIRNFLNWRP